MQVHSIKVFFSVQIPLQIDAPLCQPPPGMQAPLLTLTYIIHMSKNTLSVYTVIHPGSIHWNYAKLLVFYSLGVHLLEYLLVIIIWGNPARERLEWKNPGIERLVWGNPGRERLIGGTLVEKGW